MSALSHPRPLARDPQSRIGLRLAAALTRLGGDGCRIETMDMRPWASATFAGARHGARLRFTDPTAAAAFAEALPDAEIPLRGGFVADAEVRRDTADPCLLYATIVTIDGE